MNSNEWIFYVLDIIVSLRLCLSDSENSLRKSMLAAAHQIVQTAQSLYLWHHRAKHNEHALDDSCISDSNTVCTMTIA